MRVVLSRKHISLNSKLAREINSLARNFSEKSYSKIEDIGQLLLRHDISVEMKKRILVQRLHKAITKAFSIGKKQLGKRTIALLKQRIQGIRKIVNKLRGINYYLETTFMQDLKIPKIPISLNKKIKLKSAIARNELEVLEYTAYKLIGEAAMLDKRLLKEFKHREAKILEKEKTGLKDLSLILRKQSELLMHLEAKLPPPKAFTSNVLKEPNFSHWVSRIFALLSYFEHMYGNERIIFAKLNKNKSIKEKITKKIKHLIRERAELLKIMHEKGVSMKKLRLGDFRKELRNFTTTINL